MKIYFLAGEDSGDLHSSNLVRALKARREDLQFRGVGGDKMQAQGVELIAHVKDINFMGFWEVITHLGTIRQLFRTVKEDLQQWQPDAVVLVDYPGFNIRLLPFLKEMGVKIFYYISPQVWAWKKGRVKTIQAYVDRMMVILPFEKEFYANEGMEVDFVGHPLLDAIGEIPEKGSPDNGKPVIALLPGSRKQEIGRMLPVMLQMVSRFPEASFVVAGAPSQPESLYREMMATADAELVMNRTYEVLRKADFALVTSGTATLETGLFGVPEVVCYRGGWLSYQIGKRLVDKRYIKYISLVNLILDRPAVKELIQNDFNASNLEAALRELMQPAFTRQVQADLAELRHKLGDAGASDRAAEVILKVGSGVSR